MEKKSANHKFSTFERLTVCHYESDPGKQSSEMVRMERRKRGEDEGRDKKTWESLGGKDMQHKHDTKAWGKGGKEESANVNEERSESNSIQSGCASERETENGKE